MTYSGAHAHASDYKKNLWKSMWYACVFSCVGVRCKKYKDTFYMFDIGDIIRYFANRFLFFYAGKWTIMCKVCNALFVVVALRVFVGLKRAKNMNMRIFCGATPFSISTHVKNTRTAVHVLFLSSWKRKLSDIACVCYSFTVFLVLFARF